MNTSAFARVNIFITSTGFLLGRLKRLQKLHVRTIPLGLDNPKRIAYNPAEGIFGVGCQRMVPTPLGAAEHSQGLFRLFSQNFEALGHFLCDVDEDVTAVQVLPLQQRGKESLHFCAGTMIYQSGDDEPSQGRILLFESSAKGDENQNWLSTFCNVSGCVYALAPLQGLIAAAINTSVELYALEDGISSTRPALKKVSDWNHNYMVTNLVSRSADSTLFVGDAISSISVVRWKSETRQFETIARHFGPLWPTSIHILNESTVLAANFDCNLSTFHISGSKLEQDGNYHLGEQVNKFLNAPEARHIYCTSSGRIGVIVDVDTDSSMQLFALHRNLERAFKGCYLDHAKWRTPRNSHGVSDSQPSSTGFLDGDLLEKFIGVDATSEEYSKILEGSNAAEKLSISHGGLVSLLERFQTLH